MAYVLNNNIRVKGRRAISLEPYPINQIDKIEVEDGTPDGGLYFGHGRALISGRKVNTTYFPEKMKIDTGSFVPDYGSSYYLKFVSDRFKSIIERMEPGVHQFIPFEVIGKNNAYVGKMWFLIVCNRLDSVDREHTTLVLYRGRDWIPATDVSTEHWPPNFNPSFPAKLVFNLGQISSNHLWYDKHLGYGPYVSDALADSLQEAEITGASLVKQEAV